MAIEGLIQKPLKPSSVFLISQGRNSEKKQCELLRDFFSSEFGITVRTEVSEDDLGNSPLIIILNRPRGVLTNEIRSEPLNQMINKLIVQLKKLWIKPAGII